MSKTYRVVLQTGAYVSTTVEANTEEEAIDMAFDMAPSGVCAQCSGYGYANEYDVLDLGEWDLDDVRELGEED